MRWLEGTRRLCLLSNASFTDLEFWNGGDDLATPLIDVGELLADLSPQIPGKNQDIVRLSLRDFLRWKDRDMRPR